jgi:hypothetical protein
LLLTDRLGGWPMTAAESAAELPAGEWRRLSAGDGSKGPRTHDWALVPVAEPAPAGFRHSLLVRRNLEAPDNLAYYRVFAPEGRGDPGLDPRPAVAIYHAAWRIP